MSPVKIRYQAAHGVAKPRAVGLTATGWLMTFEEAATLGLVDEVWDDGTLVALARELQQLQFQSEDAGEGMRSNLEKGPAVFKGR